VEGGHGSDSSAAQNAVAITGMKDSGIFEGLVKTILADAAIAKESGARAKQAIVSKSLNDSYTVFASGRIDGRRDEREEILDVKDIELSFAKLAINEVVGRLGPDGL
jgi:hypothetical protein